MKRLSYIHVGMPTDMLQWVTYDAPWIPMLRKTLHLPVLASLEVHSGCTGSLGQIHTDSIRKVPAKHKTGYKQVNIAVALNDLYGPSKAGGTLVSRYKDENRAKEELAVTNAPDLDANDWVAFRGDAWHRRGRKSETCTHSSKRKLVFLNYMDAYNYDEESPHRTYVAGAQYSSLNRARSIHRRSHPYHKKKRNQHDD